MSIFHSIKLEKIGVRFVSIPGPLITQSISANTLVTTAARITLKGTVHTIKMYIFSLPCLFWPELLSFGYTSHRDVCLLLGILKVSDWINGILPG